MIMRKAKASRVLAVFLAVVMCFTMTSTVGFAATGGQGDPKEDVNLLVIGDSTTTGYMLPDFLNSNSGFSLLNNYLDDSRWTLEKAKALGHDRGGRMSVEAYPWRLKKYIEENENVNCNLIPMGINGMRTDELRALLDDEYCQKVIAREDAYTKQIEEERGIDLPERAGFLRKHMDWIAADLYDGVQNYDGYPDVGEPPMKERTLPAAQAYMKQAIADADTIVLDDCTNNFGTYNGGRISAYLGIAGQENWTPNTLETVDDVDELPEGIRNTINSLKSTIMKSSDIFREGAANQLLEMYLYDLADCLVNYTKDLEMIRELNPDARIIVVGLSNPMVGLSISSGGQVIDFGQITGAMFQLVNTYIRTMDKNAGNIYYADIYTDNITTFAQQIANSTLEELMKDTDMEEGNLGNYAINLFSEGLATQMMGLNISSMEDLEKIDPYLDDVIRETVHEALKNHGELDVDSVSRVMQGDNYNVTQQLIGGYVTAQMVKKHVDAAGVPAAQYDAVLDRELEKQHVTRANLTLDEAYWCLLNIYTRFILSSGVGLHPNKEGCAQKYDAVKGAYVKSIEHPEATAFNEVKGECEKMIEELYALLDGTPVGEDLDELIAKINKATELMAVLEESGLTADQMKELMELKDRLAEATDVLLDSLGLTMDDLYKAAMEATAPENIQKVAEQIEEIRSIVEQLPKTKEEAKAELLKQLDRVDQVLEENALGLSEELLAQLKELNAALKEAVDKEDYNIIVQKLLPIGQKLLAIGQAVAGLPEYEAAMDEYMQLTNESLANLQDRIGALEQQATELMAKSIRVDIESEVTFPDNSVKVALCWAADEDAAGYDLKKNGKDANPVEGDGVYTFEDPDVQMGETYEYEVIPYVIGTDGEKVFGKSYKATVVPSVDLAKAKLKKVTAKRASFTASWKAVKGASGYQLSYKTGKTTKVKTYDSAKKLSATVKGLKSNKKYTVKVRAYKTVNNVKYFGAWSKTKSVKIK